MVSTFIEILYSCGHQSGEGGSVSDPWGQLAEVRVYKSTYELCDVCKNPEKYPFAKDWTNLTNS